MIESRAVKDVTEWLEKFLNLETVTRDGSLEYRKAIEIAHPRALQISDRFHLVKGVREGAQQYINHLPPKIKLPTNIKVPNADEATDMEPSAGETEEHGSEPAPVDTEDSLELTESEKRRQERVEQARKLRAAGHTWKEVAKQVGVTKQTAMKYCREDYSPLSGSRGKVSKLLRPFLDEIHKGCAEGLSPFALFHRIQSKGYKGCANTLRNYLQKSGAANQSYREPDGEASVPSESTTHDDADVSDPREAEYVTRGDLSALLFHDISDMQGMTPEKLELCYALYPGLKTVYESVKTFEQILFHGTPGQLEVWLMKNANNPASGIRSFVNGTKRDLDAVSNAILLPYSNGPAEGNNTKIKSAKRVMFGRSHFSTLRIKVILKDRMKKRLRARRVR